MNLIFIIFLPVVTGYYLNLNSGSVPFLKLSDGTAVDWSDGIIAVLTDTSYATRITSRGIHFFEHAVEPSGKAVPCRRSPIALCETINKSLVFPDKNVPRYYTGNGHCGIDSAMRIIVSDPSIYDISVCDLVNGQMDVIYWQGNLHFDFNLFLPEWAYVVLAASVLYLVVSLGQNIARIMGDKDAVTMPLFTEFVCAFVVILISVLHDVNRVFVANHDKDLFWYLISYISVYVIRHGWDLLKKDDYVYTFNIILATLMLVTGRLYCSFENPYAMIYLVLLSTRWFHKIHNSDTLILKFTTVLDSILIALHYRYCFVTSFWDQNFASVYVVAIFVTTNAIGFYTSQLTEKS